jgi:hypothetical protein
VKKLKLIPSCFDIQATGYDLGYTSIVCESDCLEAVNLIHNMENAIFMCMHLCY